MDHEAPTHDSVGVQRETDGHHDAMRMADADRNAAHAAHAGHGDHGGHAGHDPEMFRRRFWLSLLLTIPLGVTSHMVMDWFGYDLNFTGIGFVGPLLGSA